MAALLSAAKGIDLKCFLDHVYADDLSVKSCTVQDLVINSQYEDITSVNGATELTDFESVVIEGNIVNYMPKGLATFFPQLISLRIFNSQLREVHQEDFASLRNLTYLNFDNNLLEMFDGDLFEFNLELQEIDFNSNQIKYIGTEFMRYLTKLKRANFQDNICTSDYFPNYYEDAARMAEVIKSKCPSPEDIRKIFCSSDIENLNKQIDELKAELQLKIQQHKEIY